MPLTANLDLEPDPVIEAYKQHVDRTLLRGAVEAIAELESLLEEQNG